MTFSGCWPVSLKLLILTTILSPFWCPHYTWYMILNTHTHEPKHSHSLWCLILIYSSALCHCSIIHITKSNILHKYFPKTHTNKKKAVKNFLFSVFKVFQQFSIPWKRIKTNFSALFFKSFLNNKKTTQQKNRKFLNAINWKGRKCEGKTISIPKKGRKKLYENKYI